MGLSIIKGVQISYIVVISVSLLPLLILTVAAIGFKTATDGIITNDMVLMLVILMVYAILAIIFYSCANSSISAVKRSIKYHDAFGSSSGFVAVASVAMSGIHVYNLFGIFKKGFLEVVFTTLSGNGGNVTELLAFHADELKSVNTMMMASTIAAIVAGLLFATIIFIHKYKLNKIIDQSYRTEYIG